MVRTSDVQLRFPEPIQAFLRKTIDSAGGREVFFLARVAWAGGRGSRSVATVDEVDVLARGNQVSVPAIIERAEYWDLAIHNHPSGVLEPSNADNEVAAALGNRSVGFTIISNDARKSYMVTPPVVDREPKPVDLDEVRAIFAPEGLLSRKLDGFESREGQLSMATEVAAALNGDRVVAAEAGTGMG